jgi:hypothetical protein
VPAPKAPDLTAVGSTLDVIDSRVAAAVTIAREANTAGKPAVVESELSVASSFLPKATPQDLAYARQRSEKASPADYERQRAKAAEKQKAAEQAWTNLEAQVAASKAALLARDKRIEELTKEVEAVRKEGSRNLWSMAGVAVAVAGALAFAFTGPRIGLPLMACGAAMGAFPFVVESPHWDLIVTVTLSLGACLLIWVAWDYARDRVNKSDQPPQE